MNQIFKKQETSESEKAPINCEKSCAECLSSNCEYINKTDFNLRLMKIFNEGDLKTIKGKDTPDWCKLNN